MHATAQLMRRFASTGSGAALARVGGASKPHFLKAKAGQPGEDAWFAHSRERVALIGVADGTSAKHGGAYARELMAAAARAAAAADGAATADVASLLRASWEDAADASIEGRSTAVLAKVDLERAQLEAVLLGDSGLLVARPAAEGGYRAALRSVAQQHYFNCPFTCGTLEGVEDNTPEDAQLLSCELEAGDVVIVGTDGLFDTMFESDILEALGEHAGADASELAEGVAAQCRSLMQLDGSRQTPLTEAAGDEGLIVRPGEGVDDVTVVLVRVD